MAHHAEIMRDEQHRQPQPVLQVEQQIDDLRLHRNIERGDRLVGDDQRGFSASARAMPMRWRWPPLKACGKRVRADCRQADQIEQLAHPRRALAPPACR